MSSGWYALSKRDAAHVNAAVSMPDQPAYDWAGVYGPDDDFDDTREGK